MDMSLGDVDFSPTAGDGTEAGQSKGLLILIQSAFCALPLLAIIVMIVVL
jgi:hypothetical protein